MYRSIDDFFVRKPKSLVVRQQPDAVLSPSEGTVVSFSSVSLLKTLWVKQKAFSISGMGVPDPYLGELEGGTVMVFKLGKGGYFLVFVRHY
eukprot:SAG31_NODE_572_length_13974_cov_28.935640_4_plen_91_part_00